MKTSMDIHISIFQQINGTLPPHHLGQLVIGKRLYALPSNSEEVHWCCASGRNFFSCVEAVRKRALRWAKAYGINDIAGVTDEKSLPVLVNTGTFTVDITPITFNDWLNPHITSTSYSGMKTNLMRYVVSQKILQLQNHDHRTISKPQQKE